MTQVQAKFAEKIILTVSFWSILQAKGEGQCGILLEKLCSKRVPPQTVALLGRERESRLINES